MAAPNPSHIRFIQYVLETSCLPGRRIDVVRLDQQATTLFVCSRLGHLPTELEIRDETFAGIPITTMAGDLERQHLGHQLTSTPMVRLEYTLERLLVPAGQIHNSTVSSSN